MGVKTAAESMLGFIERTKQYKRTHDPSIEALSQQQKDDIMQISSCADSTKITLLRTKHNQILKQIKRKVLTNREQQLDQIVADIDKMPAHSKIFRAGKATQRKTFQNLVVNDCNDKMITNV